MLPVRCFTCNKVLACYDAVLEVFRNKYKDEETRPYKEFFEEFCIRRYCCRKILLTHVDIYQYHDEPKMDHIEVRKDLEVEKIVLTD